MENKTIKVIDKDGNIMECILLSFIIKQNNIYVVYTEKSNKSFTDNLLASKVAAYKNNIYSLTALNDDEWNYIEEEYKKILKNIKNGEFNE